MSELTVPDAPKMLRESLCMAQVRIGLSEDPRVIRQMVRNRTAWTARHPLERPGTALGAPNVADGSSDTQDGGNGAERGAGDE